MKAWLDDFNLHAETEAKLLDLLEKFFVICKTKILLLSARKSVLFARELKRCGRIINADGYTMDPATVEGLKNMELPITAAELAQFVCFCRWMSQPSLISTSEWHPFPTYWNKHMRSQGSEQLGLFGTFHSPHFPEGQSTNRCSEIYRTVWRMQCGCHTRIRKK